MAPIDNRDTVSRRGALTSGLACLLGLAGVGVLASDAAAQTVGMARRLDRRSMRHDRREDRRMVRQDRRLDRRTPDVVPGTLQVPFQGPLLRFNASASRRLAARGSRDTLTRQSKQMPMNGLPFKAHLSGPPTYRIVLPRAVTRATSTYL
jgi:hypothetical protein